MAKKNLKAKTIRGIRKMIERVLTHPQELDQDSYPEGGMPACDTPFYAAGHIIEAIAPNKFKALLEIDRKSKGYSVKWAKRAAETLGFDPDAEVSRLFGAAHDWPHRYYKMYRKAEERKTEKGRLNGIAKAFKARWEGFIKSDGKDINYPYYPEEIKEAHDGY